MTRRMLIDAAHAEETRVVVAEGTRLLDYDHESSTKKQIKGNFYLAKVTRVEPSLQAAFVEFGGNRHGFLAFNEIHPDYYKIPMEDREALLKDSRADADSDEGEDDDAPSNGDSVEELGGDESEDIERAGEAQRRRLRSAMRQYKIQEVIKRRQILLVQVVKEERGNKGAALTTYLSLAGRYCVLMPNTARGGGISRKITSPPHRKRLRALLQDLEVPTGMGVILRTAGVERSKAEIKRDYEYLRRQWDEIRARTLDSTAPALIHEEGDVIKRALRDLYAREIEEVLIDGDEAYKTARTFMKTMIPSHVKRIKKYEDTQIPMFHRYGIEAQLDSIHESNVHLPSGGYIVLNSTEALVAIDVNSGRATRQRNIEQTALQTNLEAAEEVARQLRLRDLAGLVVIDFIDMEEQRNNNSVERRLKESMRIDRARIQVGHISHFGLLELSRQRLRPSLIEVSTRTCEVCGGAGVVRSTESTSLKVLRAIEEEGIQKRTGRINVALPNTVALYVLNQKRKSLADIEARHDLSISITADDSLITPDFRIDRSTATEEAEAATEEEKRPRGRSSSSRRSDDRPAEPDREETSQADADNGEERGRRRRRRSRRRRDDGPRETEVQATAEETTDAGEDAPRPAEEEGRRRRRRGRGGRGGRSAATVERADTKIEAANDDGAEPSTEPPASTDEKPEQTTPRRRTRRGSRRRANADTNTETQPDANGRAGSGESPIFATEGEDGPGTDDQTGAEVAASGAAVTETETSDTEPKPTRRRSSSRRTRGTRKKASADEAAPSDAPTESQIETTAPEPQFSPDATAENIVVPPAAETTEPRRRGWWNKP